MLGRNSNPTERLKQLKRVKALSELQSRKRPPRPQPRVHRISQRLSEGTLNQIAADYIAGSTTPELMALYKLGKGTVLEILKDRGVAMRNQGLPTDKLPDAIKMYESGLSLKAVAAKFGCDAETVRMGLKAAGVARRNAHKRKRLMN